MRTPRIYTSPIYRFLPNSALRFMKHGWGSVLTAIALGFTLYSTFAVAEISFDGNNRFVMSGRRTSITIVNDGVDDALTEVSVSWGDNENTNYLPLVTSKSLLKIPVGGRADVNVLYQGEGLPEDRESYLLLNVLDVPTAAHEPNNLQIALRHRLKLFYRPPLKETPDDAMAKLGWELQGDDGLISATNPSPYYLTLSDIEVIDRDHQSCGEPIKHLMISPFSSSPLEIPHCSPKNLRFDIVSDAGNTRPYQVELTPNKNNLGSKRM